MVEISTSILSVETGNEAETFLLLEKSKTDYFHIDVMDGKFVKQDTYQKMIQYSNYIKRTIRCTFNGRRCRNRNRSIFSR